MQESNRIELKRELTGIQAVAWVSVSVTQYLWRLCVGLRLAPNSTYGLRKTLINDIVTGKIKVSNGHGKCVAPDDETCHARSPHLNPLPQAGEEANESLREFHINEVV